MPYPTKRLKGAKEQDGIVGLKLKLGSNGFCDFR